jgi:hypothetical protein
MSPRQMRAPGACTDPLAYAGSVAIPRRRAANDNRPAGEGARRGWMRVPARAAAIAVAGAAALGSLAHVTLRFLAGSASPM